jgi:WD40 repeat protein
METINPLKDLGKCFLKDVNKPPFISGTTLESKTYVSMRKLPYGFKIKTEKGTVDYIPAFVTDIDIGKDYNYRVSLKLPEGTEMVRIWDLKDGRQVIQYLHHSETKKIVTRNNIVYPLETFANEFRSADNRIEIRDIIPKKPKNKVSN